MATQAPRPETAPPLDCDIVMRGGVTAGIVYPGAVSEIASRCRLRSIGGTSAGALAAGAAAAMEFGRSSGRNPAAVERIRGLADELATELDGVTLLSRLLTPADSTRPAHDLLMALVDRQWLRALASQAGRALFLPLVVIPVAIFLLLGGLVWLYLERTDPSGDAAEVVLRGIIFVSLVFLLTVLVAIVQVRRGIIANWLERTLAPVVANGFGIASGWDGTDSSIAGWAHKVVQELAGLPEEEPLTFGDLWTASRRVEGKDREAAQAEACDAAGVEEDALAICPREIDLKLITTDLNRRLLVQLPFPNDSLHVRVSDLERRFPPPVVAWMRAHAGPRSPYPAPDGAELIALPAPHDLPVLFAMRLSMSFPLLISAVPLLVARRTGEDAHELVEVWLSDGGITSNFPIHLFDSPIPGRPTFCLNLLDPGEEIARDDFGAGAGADFLRRPGADGKEEGHLYMPSTNRGALGLLKRFRGRSALKSIGQFLGLVFDTSRSWNDSMAMEVPGFRDRIIHIWLATDDNAFDFRMPAWKIRRLDAKGREAGQVLARRFEPGQQEDPLRPGTMLKLGWANHRFVRFRASLAGLEVAVQRFAAGWVGPAAMAKLIAGLEPLLDSVEDIARRTASQRAAGPQTTPSYREMLDEAGTPREPEPRVGFAPENDDQRVLLRRMSDLLTALATLSFADRTQADLVDGKPTSPRPKPLLRARPAFDDDIRDQRPA